MRAQAPTGLKVSSANAQQNSPDDLAMAAAVSINKVIRRKRGNTPKRRITLPHASLWMATSQWGFSNTQLLPAEIDQV